MANDIKVGNRLKSTEKTFLKSPYYTPSFDYPYNPDPLSRGNDYSIYDEMREDDQVKAVLSLKKDLIISTGYDIECENEEISEFLEKDLENIDNKGLEPNFDDILRDILSAFDYGFSLSEVVYQMRDDNLYHIDKIKTRPPHTFEFDIDDFGNVTKVIQNTMVGKKIYNPNIFLDFVYQQEYGQPYGKSDLLSAYIAWKSKKHFLRLYPMYVERFASPIIKGEYDPSSDDTEIDRIFTVMKKIQNNSVVLLPSGTNSEFMQPEKDASEVYIKGINMYNLMIGRALLVPDLIGLSGEKTAGGSFALGKEQFGIFFNQIKKHRRTLENKINSKVITPLVKANWGDDIDCKFVLKPFSTDDELELKRLWLELVKTGKYTPSDDEINKFRNITNMPEGEVEKPEQIKPEIPTEKPNGNKEPKKENPKGDIKDGNLRKETNPDEKNKMGKKEFAFSRELTPYEKKINFNLTRNILDNSEKALARALELITPKMNKSFTDMILEKGIIRNFSPEKINAIQPNDIKFRKDMRFIFRANFEILFKAAINQAITELGISETKTFANEDLIPKEFADLLSAETFKLVGDYTFKITTVGKSILNKGIRDGLGEAQLVKKISAELDDTSDRWTKTVVRTKTTDIYNKSRTTYWQTDKVAKEIVVAYQFSAILDSRTSQVCTFLDGQIFKIGQFSASITPPIHMNCRSVLVPVTKFEDFKLNKQPSLSSLKNKGGNLIL